MTWCLLGLQKWPQEDESEPLNEVLSCVWLNFRRGCTENRNWGLQEVDPLASSAAFTGTFLTAECLKPALSSCLEEGRPVLSGC